MSYTDVPEFSIPSCTACGGESHIAPKGCWERRFRISCLKCGANTGWAYSPEAALAVWGPKQQVTGLGKSSLEQTLTQLEQEVASTLATGVSPSVPTLPPGEYGM